MARTLALVVTTAAVCFGIAASTGIGARPHEPVYVLDRGGFAAATVSTLNLRCEFEPGISGPFSHEPLLLCGHYVKSNAGGGIVLLPLGVVVRLTSDKIAVERFGENGYVRTLFRTNR